MKQLLGGILLAVALFGCGYWLGGKQASSTCAAAQAKAQQASQTKADETSARREEVAQAREVTRERIRVVYRTIREKADETIKTNPAAYDCALDSDGLREWNAANAGASAPVPAEPDYRLLDAAISQVRRVGRFVAEPHRGDGVIRAMPRSTEQAGRVREGGQ